MFGIGSKIPLARANLENIIRELAAKDDPLADRLRDNVLSMLTRKAATRKAPPEKIVITRRQRAQIHQLASTTEMSLADIAVAVGLKAKDNGRISEVLDGLR